jgi:hypothetical protein
MNADERRYFHSSWCAAPMFNSFENRTLMALIRIKISEIRVPFHSPGIYFISQSPDPRLFLYWRWAYAQVAFLAPGTE